MYVTSIGIGCSNNDAQLNKCRFQQCAKNASIKLLQYIHCIQYIAPPDSTYLRDVSCSGEDKGYRADGARHVAECDLVAGVSYGLESMVGVPVVVGGANVLQNHKSEILLQHHIK